MQPLFHNSGFSILRYDIYEMEGNRIDYLDTCKGLLIILVVIGHAIEIVNPTHDNYFLKLVYSFHMPAFFVISGYLYNPNKWNEQGFKFYIKRRMYKCLIPYFFFDFLYGLAAAAFIYQLNWKGVIAETPYIIKHSFSIKVNYVPSWFLITLFFSSLFLYWIFNNTNTKKVVSVFFALLLVTIAGKYYIQLNYPRITSYLRFALRIVLCTEFMLIGQIWKQTVDQELKKPYTVCICLSVLLCFSFFFSWESISSFTIKYIIPFVITGIAGTYVIVEISKRVNCHPLKFLGRESMIIMGTHQFVRYTLLYRFTEINSSKYAVLVYLFSVIILESILIPVLNKYTPKLIGK